MDNKKIISDFISQIWNAREFDKINEFADNNFLDHYSLILYQMALQA